MLSLIDIIEYKKAHGTANLLKSFANKLNRFLFKQDNILLGRTKLSSIPEVECIVDFKYCDLTLADLEKLQAFRWDLSEYRRWFLGGVSFKGAELNGKIIGFIAFSKKVEPPFDKATINQPDDIWVTYCNILPEYRGKRICPKIMHLAAKEYIADGYENFHLAVDANNSSSMKMHEWTGFKPYAKIKQFTIFGIKKFRMQKV